MVLSLFQLSQFYNAEIIRGRYNYGQHNILPVIAHLYKQDKDKPILPEFCDPTTIIQTIKDAERDVDAHYKKCELNVEQKHKIETTTNNQEKVSIYERALSVINDKDGISMRPKSGEFIVKGTLGTGERSLLTKDRGGNDLESLTNHQKLLKVMKRKVETMTMGSGMGMTPYSSMI